MNAKDRTGQADWQRRPMDEELGMHWPIWRVSANRKHQVIVLSHDLVGCYTHYWGGRTVPCTVEPCQACDHLSPRRWHGWLATRTVSGGMIGILEITAKSSTAIDEYFRAHRTLRGALLTCWRSPQRANGRIIAQLILPAAAAADLPVAPDVQAQLTRMWEHGKQKPKPPMTPAATPPGEHEHALRIQKINQAEFEAQDPRRTGTD